MKNEYSTLKSGMVKKSVSGESIVFSPKPIPTLSIEKGGVGPQPEVLNINDVYLDIGTGTSGVVLQGRLNAMAMSIAIIFLTVAFFVAVYPDNSTEGDFNDFLIMVFCVLFAISIGLIIQIKGMFWDRRKQVPIRFNRQKREVAFYEKNSSTPIIFPWEEVVCWGSTDKIFTGSAVASLAMFGLAFKQDNSEDYWTIKSPVPMLMSAQRHWETIRCFMDESPEYWPEVGSKETRETYYQEKKDFFNSWELKQSNCRVLKIVWFYLFRVITWGVIPYLIAEFDNKLSAPKHSKIVEEWSQPIPPSEWTQPSDELLALKHRAQAHYQQGGTFFDLNLDS